MFASWDGLGQSERLTLVVVDVFAEQAEVRILDGAAAGAQCQPSVAGGGPQVEHERAEVVVPGDVCADTLPTPDLGDWRWRRGRRGWKKHIITKNGAVPTRKGVMTGKWTSDASFHGDAMPATRHAQGRCA